MQDLQTNPTVVAVNTKSPVLAFILVLLAGPLGFLYVNVLLGIVLLVLYGLFFLVTLGFGGIVLAVLNVPLAILGAVMVVLGNRGQMRRLSRPIMPS